MSYKIKTLIVFDTNTLRSTQGGKVAYSFFTFGGPFLTIEKFLTENGLLDDIQLAIPTWALEEIKDQKQIQYKEDILEFKKLAKRLSGLPHIPEISLPDEEFDCVAYIEEKAIDFLKGKSYKLIEIEDEIANSVLRSMMLRVMKDEALKRPFVHAKRKDKDYKDAGFKDNLIWESLLHFKEIENYDKVIFLTGDSDYTNCKDEFTGKWNKHFSISTDENYVIAELKKDYELYIKERAIYDFAQTDYFKDYLFDGLKTKTEICFEVANFKIENFEIVDTCTNVERMPPNEDLEENVIIHSSIKIFFSENTEKKQQIVITKATLADEETKEFLDLIFEPELI